MEFLQPFYHAFDSKKLIVEVQELNWIPSWARTDWKLFREALFHTLRNAVKFSRYNGRIVIAVSYHSLEPGR